MLQVLSVALFGALGSVCRFGLALWLRALFPKPFPLGTLVVNVLGCFFIGLLAVIFIERLNFSLSPVLRAGILVGFLGGFTTFSTFSWDAWDLVLNGYWLNAVLYVGASFILCLAATGLGIYIGKI